MKKDNFCVIMAGGIGSRFWPLSSEKKPKQFLDILGTGRTLLQQTFDRFKKIIHTENIFIVTSSIYKNLVTEQIPEINENQILLEPFRRNTAPCISYANNKIKMINPKANIIVAPSDHIILNENKFLNVIEKGLKFVLENNSLLTLGIKPNRPETGYGYIQIEDNKKEIEDCSLVKVKTFTEKPNLELAKLFLKSGEFYWNSGMFLWSLESITKAFEEHLPEVNELFTKDLSAYNTKKEKDFIESVYARCKNISIDYGIMEKTKDVFVICSDFGWSDLGTWSSLYEHSEKDQFKNSINSKNVCTYDTKNCIINLPKGKTAVLQGLDNYIVVEKNNTLLICKKEEEQQIRNFVHQINLK